MTKDIHFWIYYCEFTLKWIKILKGCDHTGHKSLTCSVLHTLYDIIFTVKT